MAKWEIATYMLSGLGAATWATVAWFNFNLVTVISTSAMWVKLVYTLIGLSGLYILYKAITK